MGPGAIGSAFEQGRPSSAAGAAHGFARGLVNGQHVVAVEVDAGDSVARATISHAGVAGSVCEGHLGRILVVFADEENGQLPDSRHVEPFVKSSVVDGSVAEKCDGHVIALQQRETISGARCLEDAGPDDSAGAHHADIGGEEMHAAAAPLRATCGSAEELGKQAAGRETLGEGMAVTAVGAEDDVFLLEVCADADGDGLLPDIRVARAVDEPALM